MAIYIEPMQATDWPAVAEIYRQGIATRLATFETEVPSWEHWDSTHMASCRFVAKSQINDEILGWAALTPVSSRCVYAGVAEVSVYIAEAARGQGIGKALLLTLIEASEKENIWTLQASLFPENIASSTLHKTCGFREIGYRERVAQLDGVWRNTVMLERRSTVTGV